MDGGLCISNMLYLLFQVNLIGPGEPFEESGKGEVFGSRLTGNDWALPVRFEILSSGAGLEQISGWLDPQYS